MDHKKKGGLLLAFIYLISWAFAEVFFWLMDPADAGGFSLIFIWVLLPVVTFGESLVIGLKGFWGKWAWLAVPVYGLGLMALEWFTFSLANYFTTGNLNAPEWSLFLIGAAVSAAGLGLGKGIALLKR